MALAFEREGAALIGVHYARNADAAQTTIGEIEALGSKAVAIKADLSRGEGSNRQHLGFEPSTMPVIHDAEIEE